MADESPVGKPKAPLVIKTPATLHADFLNNAKGISKVLILRISNCSDQKQTVNLFSLRKAVPEGVDVSCLGFGDDRDISYDGILNYIQKKPFFFHIFQIVAEEGSSPEEFINCIERTREFLDGSNYFEKIHPLMYFSEMQMQETILHCMGEFFFVDGCEEMVWHLNPNQELMIRFYLSGELKEGWDYKEKIRERSIQLAVLEKQKKIFDNVLPIIIENAHPTERKEIRLFDYKNFAGKTTEIYIQNGVKIYTPDGFNSYEQSLLIFSSYHSSGLNQQPFAKNNKVKIWAKDFKSFRSAYIFVRNVEKNDKQEIIQDIANQLSLANYFSAYQMQNVITADLEYNYGIDSELKILVEPNTKMVLLFYRDIAQAENKPENFIEKYGVVSE